MNASEKLELTCFLHAKSYIMSCRGVKDFTNLGEEQRKRWMNVSHFPKAKVTVKMLCVACIILCKG